MRRVAEDDETASEKERDRRHRDRTVRRPGEDPVLDEALMVLVDLIDLHGSPPGASPANSFDATEEDFLRSFFQ